MTANELVKIRQKLGLSQSQLARELGVSQQAVSLWELGHRPVPQPIVKLLHFLAALK